MVLDLIALGAILLFALIGAMTGALSQVVHLLGIVAAWATARFVGLAIGPRIAAELKMPAIVGVALSALALGAVAFILVHVFGRWLLRRLQGTRGPGPADRAAGVLLGAVKSAAIVWCLLSVLVFFDRPLKGLGWKMDLAGSEVAGLVRQHNLLAHTGLPLPELERALSGVRQRTGGGAAASATGAGPLQGSSAAESKAARELAKDPRMRRLAADPQVQEALQKGDYVTVLRRPEVLELLADPDARAKLLQFSAAGGAP
ncbi:MAG: CvpA family protein [Deltaproteobacteria bacterium]|nr:CvpA family protein [Deltaproteobacteria bacterium]